MLTQDYIDKVVVKIGDLSALAEKQFARTFPLPKLYFNARGRTAGYYLDGILHFNPILLVENGVAFIDRTVGHEYAHYIQFILFPHSKDHGREWKLCMRNLGLNPVRCHNYDVSNATCRHHKKYHLVCNCREHHVTSRILSKIRTGMIYRCRFCKSSLKEKSS